MDEFKQQPYTPLHLQIAAHLKNRILTGEFPPGCRLPTTSELAAKYQVTQVTVQKSLEHITKQDLLTRVPKRGTFVKNPQLANTIGIIFSWNLPGAINSYYVHLMNLFIEKALTHNLSIKNYICNFQLNEYRVLYDIKEDVAEGRVKALIPMCSFPMLSDWLREDKKVFYRFLPPNDFRQGTYEAIRYLLKQGYRKIRMVSQLPEELLYPDHREFHEQEVAGFKVAMAEAGLEFSPVLRWNYFESEGYRRTKELLRSPDRPEALFINHDMMTRGALLAIYELGLRVPQDIAILTHYNSGCEITSPVKLSKLVYDPEDVVNSTLSGILRHLDKPVPKDWREEQIIKGHIVSGRSCNENIIQEKAIC